MLRTSLFVSAALRLKSFVVCCSALSISGKSSQAVAMPNKPPVTVRNSQVLSRSPVSCVRPSTAIGRIRIDVHA